MSKVIQLTRDREHFHRIYARYRVGEHFTNQHYDCCQNCGINGNFEFAFCSANCIELWFYAAPGMDGVHEAKHIERLRQDVETAQRALNAALRSELSAQIKVAAEQLITAISENENAVAMALHHIADLHRKWFSAQHDDDGEIPF